MVTALWRRPGILAALSGAVGLSLVLASCTGGSPAADGGGTTADESDCTAYERYGDLSGTAVSVYAPLTGAEAQSHVDSYLPFERCTGADVRYEGSREFEAQLPVRIEGGRAPDIAYLPQPSLLAALVRDTGAVIPAPQQVATNVERYFPETFRQAGSVDGTLYAAPLGATVKSYVWYSPTAFAENGYRVPTTWDEMIALSDRIAADGGTPWCAAIGSGAATGGPLTDLLEDAVLREAGPEVYDRWVAHEIPFDDPQVARALDRVGGILKNPRYVVDLTADAAVLEGDCFMMRRADRYAADWPEGTDIAEDGQVFAFPLPPLEADAPPPVLVDGELVVAFDDRPEVAGFQAYLSSPEWADEKAKATTALGRSGWISANSGLDPANLASPIDRASVEILQSTETVLRFDGSDLMPGPVGSGTFPAAMTNWVDGASTAEALTLIEASWPQ